MKPEIKETWVAALESGDLKQGRGTLHRKSSFGRDEFCCLGVLCHLAYQAGAVSRVEGDAEFFYGEEINGADLPREVIEWAGLAAADPKVWVDFARLPENFRLDAEEVSHHWYLSNANDRYLSFATIAQLIRESDL